MNWQPPDQERHQELHPELHIALTQAAAQPAIANLPQLWQQLESVLVALPLPEQLQQGSATIAYLADIYQAKANTLLEDWENKYDPQDPVCPGDWLQGLVKQTQYLDLSDLTAPLQRRTSPPSAAQPEPDSVVGDVPKANVLQMLDQVEAETQTAAALAVAHEERIQTWVAEVHRWFDQHPQPLPLLQLQQQLDWPLVQLWLSLLLGDFCLEPSSDSHFYSTGILVSRP